MKNLFKISLIIMGFSMNISDEDKVKNDENTKDKKIVNQLDPTNDNKELDEELILKNLNEKNRNFLKIIHELTYKRPMLIWQIEFLYCLTDKYYPNFEKFLIKKNNKTRLNPRNTINKLKKKLYFYNQLDKSDKKFLNNIIDQYNIYFDQILDEIKQFRKININLIRQENTKNMVYFLDKILYILSSNLTDYFDDFFSLFKLDTKKEIFNEVFSLKFIKIIITDDTYHMEYDMYQINLEELNKFLKLIDKYKDFIFFDINKYKLITEELIFQYETLNKLRILYLYTIEKENKNNKE